MGRAEEIIKASTDTFKENGDEFAKVVKLFWMSAFISGAKWSDEHPQNMWHSADEQPVGEDWKILLEDKSGNCWVASRHCVFPIYFNWEEYALDKALTRWAYISDLLPKGGE